MIQNKIEVYDLDEKIDLDTLKKLIDKKNIKSLLLHIIPSITLNFGISFLTLKVTSSWLNNELLTFFGIFIFLGTFFISNGIFTNLFLKYKPLDFLLHKENQNIYKEICQIIDLLGNKNNQNLFISHTEEIFKTLENLEIKQIGKISGHEYLISDEIGNLQEHYNNLLELFLKINNGSIDFKTLLTKMDEYEDYIEILIKTHCMIEDINGKYYHYKSPEERELIEQALSQTTNNEREIEISIGENYQKVI